MYVLRKMVDQSGSICAVEATTALRKLKEARPGIAQHRTVTLVNSDEKEQVRRGWIHCALWTAGAIAIWVFMITVLGNAYVHQPETTTAYSTPSRFCVCDVETEPVWLESRSKQDSMFNAYAQMILEYEERSKAAIEEVINSELVGGCDADALCYPRTCPARWSWWGKHKLCRPMTFDHELRLRRYLCRLRGEFYASV